MAAAVPTIDSAAAAANVQVREFLKDSPKKLLIGGKWVPARSGKTFETINPANEEVLGLVAEGDKADVDDAVRVARKAFETGKWPSMGPHQRARYLFQIADLIEANADELAELITLDNGKPISESIVEVGRTADTFRYYGGWSTKYYGETNPSDPGFFNYTLTTRADRSLRTDHSVERSARNDKLESRTSARFRQHVGPQGCGTESAPCHSARRINLRKRRA